MDISRFMRAQIDKMEFGTITLPVIEKMIEAKLMEYGITKTAPVRLDKSLFVNGSLNLSDNALTVLERRYLKRDSDGKLIETPEHMFKRVAHHIANAESKFGAMSAYLPMGSIQGIFREVDKGTAKFGVIPIENSSNGIVSDTINCLDEYNLKIIAEVMIDVHFAFATLSEDIKQIKKIYSKDIAFGQCRLFLQDLGLDDVELVPVESTAKAAKIAAQDESTAALCPAIAAKLYNLPIRFENIEDNTNNRTRFFIISNFENLPSGNDKTSILVRLSNKPGALVNFLNDFEEANVNLTKIKSHIVGGESIFFIEFHGHKDDEKIKPILTAHQDEIKILGSYVKETDD
ncbi:MAG: chloride transporter, partial [Deltaproteobacteria bacterium]